LKFELRLKLISYELKKKFDSCEDVCIFEGICSIAHIEKRIGRARNAQQRLFVTWLNIVKITRQYFYLNVPLAKKLLLLVRGFLLIFVGEMCKFSTRLKNRIEFGVMLN
jgi:hypothetical protein